MILAYTRAFGLALENAGEKTASLVPFADMFNYTHHDQTEWGYDSSR